MTLKRNKTLYLWDLGSTLFSETWDAEKTGFPTHEDWVAEKLGKPKETLSAETIDRMYEIPYKEGWYMNLDLAKGFQDVLSWTKENEVFTSGIPEQIEWRAIYLNPKVGFDIKKYFKKINSASHYGAYNTKTKGMFSRYLEEKYSQGYRTVVYTDDNFKYCTLFQRSAEDLKAEHKDFSYRLYHILNDNNGLRREEGYFSIGNLYDFLENEKNY